MKTTSRRREGFTLLEITIGMTIMTVGVLGLAASFVHSSRLSEDARDTRTMAAAVENLVAELKSADFQTLPQQYGSGTAQASFWCLEDGSVVFTDPGGAGITGTISFFSDESAVPSTFAALTGGFDLNADGLVTTGSITDFRILPARVTFTATSMSGSRSRTVDFVLSPKNTW